MIAGSVKDISFPLLALLLYCMDDGREGGGGGRGISV